MMRYSPNSLSRKVFSNRLENMSSPCPQLCFLGLLFAAFWTCLFMGAHNPAHAEPSIKQAKPAPSQSQAEQKPASVENQPISQVSSIMQQQLLTYRNKLTESARRLEEFQKKHGIISLEEQRGLLLRQRQELDSSLKSAENRAKGFKEKLAWVKEQIRDVPEQIPLSSVATEQSVISSAKSNLLNLQLREQELLGKYTEKSPHIKALHREMELIKEFIKEQEAKLAGSVTTGKNPLYQEMEMQLFHTEADLISAEAQAEVIQQQIKEVNSELDRLTGLSIELEDLRRQVTADEKNYLAYLTKVGTSPPQDYAVQVGDLLDIKFFFNPELNETILVRQDGRIAMQLIGEVSVVGQTVEQIRANLMKQYAGQLKNPEIAVLLRSSNVPAESAIR